MSAGRKCGMTAKLEACAARPKCAAVVEPLPLAGCTAQGEELGQSWSKAWQGRDQGRELLEQGTVLTGKLTSLVSPVHSWPS